jgi:hypothetical protein
MKAQWQVSRGRLPSSHQRTHSDISAWRPHRARSTRKQGDPDIAARDPVRQTAEIQIRVALMNRFNALGLCPFAQFAALAAQTTASKLSD